MDEESDAGDIVIILPEIVRNFSEVKITEEADEFFFNILTKWYEQQLHEIYVKNETITLTVDCKMNQND